MISKTRIFTWIRQKERQLTGLPGRLLTTGRMLLMAGLRFHRDLCLERAATLSFASIISLIPLTVLFVSFAGMLGGGERIIAHVQDEVFPLVAPEFQDQLNEWLDNNISPDAFRAGSTGIVNVAAILALLISALGLLVTAERVFNRIWRVPGDRSYLQKAMAFWVIVTTSPFLIAASISVSEFLVPEGGSLDRLTKDYWILGTVYQFVVPLAVGFIGFSTLYLLLPATKVRLKSACAAGIAAAILWELSKTGFFLYVSHATSATSFYGQLATVPLFLIWVYVNWTIILIGAEIGYTHQHFEAMTVAARRSTEMSIRRSKAFVGFEILTRLKDAFTSGTPAPEVDVIADDIGISSQDLAGVASLLEAEGYLIEDARNAGHYVLACSPDSIGLKEVAALLVDADFRGERSEGSTSKARDHDPVTGANTLVARAWGAFLTSLDGETLGDAEP